MPTNISTSDSEVRKYITHNNAEGLARYFSTLPYGSKLTVVNHNDIAVDTLHQLQIISQALEHNATITNLDLSWNNISDVGVEFLTRALTTNFVITQLDLFGNSIGAVGAEHIAGALATSAITTLDLGRNNIGDAGAASIADALANNTSITQLYLAFNHIGDQGISALSQALQNNTTLRALNLGALNLDENNITLASEAVIIDLLKNSHISALIVDVDSIEQAIKPLLEENRLINEFIDNVKQNASFGGIDMGYLLPYFDFSPAAKEKINKRLLQEKLLDSQGQEHSVASLISHSIPSVENALMKLINQGAKSSSSIQEKIINKFPPLVIKDIFSAFNISRYKSSIWCDMFW